MKLIICLDDNNGMMFNNRRQSKDCEVRKRILSIVGTDKLWMSEYTATQFEESVEVCSDVQQADYIFAENPDDVVGMIFDQIIVFRWNRKYPGDKFYNLESRVLQETMEFSGNSHELITQEVYQ